MKIILCTTMTHLINESKNDPFFDGILEVVDDISMLKNKYLSSDTIIIDHLKNTHDTTIAKEILHLNPTINLIALSNTPSNVEGCRFLEAGFKSYLHAYSNIEIIKEAIQCVYRSNVYVYPELMNFLIHNLSTKTQTKNGLENITEKEMQVLVLLSNGLKNKEIANDLGIAEVTVKKHINSMFEKLDVKDRLSLAMVYKSSTK